jgi:hypothetical protein
MPDNRSHLFLLNPSGEKRNFNAGRGYVPKAINQKPAGAYTSQKVILGDSLSRLFRRRAQRREKRTLDLPFHLELIQIDFLVVFNNNDSFQNKSKFKNNFGLIPIVYSNFNQTVIFAIADEQKFQNFVSILNSFINSLSTQHPSGTEYAVITIIKDFEFLDTDKVIEEIEGSDFLLSIVNDAEEIRLGFVSIFESLLQYLEELKKSQNISDYQSDGVTTIQIKTASIQLIQSIAENFDIVYRIQSIRVPSIRPNIYNQPDLTWNLEIHPPTNSQVKIGILDNGVKDIAPLKNIIIDYGFDITSSSPAAMSANSPHGTIVASLAALGLEYFDTSKHLFTSDAWIVPIKILNFNTGSFNPYDIEDVIKKAFRKGVKIFNLSVCGPGKNYNSTISEYAFLLDRLTFKYDILIFIATGNLDFLDIENMSQEILQNGFHDYPNHFYNPSLISNSHNCECSNICIPAESMNNITVGALADNCNQDSVSDLTPFKELPAYYTRKHFIDYSRKVNGTFFSDSQTNSNINKPDIVMPGGDVLNNSSGMHVLGFGLNGNDFFSKESGTSLATPLATNLAAKIANFYPALNMQSVKALILNSSTQLLSDTFLNDLIEKIRNEEAQKVYGCDFDSLQRAEKISITTNINCRDLYRKLVGHGKPEVDKALYSNSKTVTVLVQDSIFVDSYKAININIPDYLLKYTRPSYILSLKATLCYRFYPVFNNHLGYNPLHISFNFIKSVEKNNPSRVAEIISNRDDIFFNQFYEAGFNDKEKLKARRKALGIKSEIQSWSEDFYPRSNKPFSNSQAVELKISVEELKKIDQQISLIVRCTCKTDYNKDLVDWLKATPHEFSVALNISEKDNNELIDFDLYDELHTCNTLDLITKLDVQGEQEADVIIEADL